MDPYIGKMLDNRYEILEIIGTGGMAMVYKAHCHRLNRLVAIKVLKEELADDADFRRRFQDESQAVAMLSHPNIVSVYDVSHSSDTEYIVMELIDGITLKQYMQQKGALPWREALHFITQIMKALSHAHSRGIIHRDIKPQNIMILRDGTVKVADFGIARLVSSTQSTLTQEALGSVHYISPEQAKGSHIDARSDIYSAGVVLYEMLTGRLPFEGDSPVAVAIQHISSVPLSPRELNPDIQEGLEAIVMKAMAQKVQNRYSSADEMLADLEEFRKNPDINIEYNPNDVVPPELVDEPTQMLPKAGVVTASVTENTTRRLLQEQTSVETAEQQADETNDTETKPHRRRNFIITIVAILVLAFGISYFLIAGSRSFRPADSVVVPNVVGQELTEVQENEEYAEMGFTFTVGNMVTSEQYEAGVIVNQSPDADRTVKGNREIVVDVSIGTTITKMPNIYNMEVRAAQLMLQSMGLDLNIVEAERQYSDVITENYVISYTPKEGTELKRGDTVTMVVSKGREINYVTMPSLIGQQENTARGQLMALNLKVGATVEVESERPAGEVIGQSIQATAEIPEGTAVDLTISKGPSEFSPTVDYSAQNFDEGSGASGSMVLDITLPEGDGDVTVMVKQESETIYHKTVDRSAETLSLTLTGSGVQYVQVYFDDELVESQYISFDPQ